MPLFLQYPDTIKRRFGRRIGQPTGISRQPLRPPPRSGIPLRQNGCRHRDTAVPFRRRPPRSRTVQRCGRSASDPENRLKQHRRPQKNGRKAKITNSLQNRPRPLFRKQKTKEMKRIPIPPFRPLRTARFGRGRPPSRYLSGRLRFRIRMPKILNSAIFSLLSQDYR